MTTDFKHELVLPNENLSFKLFLFRGKEGDYRRAKHWHRSVGIFPVPEGKLEFFVDSTSLLLTAPDFVIVDFNETHSAKVPTSNTTTMVQTPVNCFTGYLEENDYVVFSKGSEEEGLKLAGLIIQTCWTYREKGLVYELKMYSLFLELLYLLVISFMEGEEDQGNIRQKRRLDKLSRITSCMEKNYNQGITLESVTDLFGFSLTYLSRIFQQYVNVSYKTYLLSLRTEYGLWGIVNMEHSLNDVMSNNGLPDSRALAETSSKQYGCLPSEYRHRMGRREGNPDPGDKKSKRVSLTDQIRV